MVIQDSRFDGDISIRAGSDADGVVLQEIFAENVAVRTDSGDDGVVIEDSTFTGDELFLDGGAGAGDGLAGDGNTLDEDMDVDILGFEEIAFVFDRSDEDN